MELILFLLALVAIFTVKALVITRYSVDEAAKGASFSWLAPQVPDADAVPAWNQPSAPAAHVAPARPHVSVLRHPKAA